MEHDALRARLRAVMATVFETTPTALPVDADTDSVEKWDSLGHLMLVESLEEAFGVAFSHEETLAMLTEDAVLDHLTHRLQADLTQSVGA